MGLNDLGGEVVGCIHLDQRYALVNMQADHSVP
jgi:hypothetical protein